MAFSLDSRFLYRVLIIGLDKETKGSTFQTFFSSSVAVPHFVNGPFKVPEQLAVKKKILKVKGYAKGIKNC